MADYLQEWTAKAGKDNFGADPPNAAVSVYEAGQPDSTLAVVEITNPRVDDADSSTTTNHQGQNPVGRGQTTLFIDWIGAGGGVGAGFTASVSAPGARASARGRKDHRRIS